MVIGKWNYEKHDYEPYEVPNNKILKTYSTNMEEVVNCCQCLKEMKFGDGYTSMEVHTNIGFGYCVCEECYNKEWERRKKYKNEED